VGRSSRWLVFLPVAFLALLPTQANAEPEPGLNAVGYLIDQIPPERSDDTYPTCGSEVENNINRNFNGEPFQDCGWDFFMVHYSGFIDIPEHETIQFMVAADDGGTINISGQEFGTWNIKACSWSAIATLELDPGPNPLDGWFFEAGGGTCYMLAWNIDDIGWEIVPEWAYTTASTPPTTTSTSTVLETTVPATTTTSTTVQETTTSTTEAPSTSTTEISTSTTSSLPPSTTTSVDTTPPATLATPAWVPPPTSTTTAPATTVPEVSTTAEPPPPTTLPEIPTTSLAPPSTVRTTTTLAAATTMAPVASTAPPVSATPETVPNTPENVLEAPIASPEQVAKAVDAILETPPSPDQAAYLATNAQVLAVVSTTQAEEIFEALDVTELDDTQVAALIEAVQDAPQEIRETFEENVDIFKTGLDTYVPVGSNIPVGARRTLVAIGAVLTMLPPPTRIRP
jgi:hypothetical protein